MTNRSRAREVALQLLFQLDHNSNVQRADVERFVQERLRDPVLPAFCLHLYDGVLAHRPAIDERLAAAAENWRLARMAGVDRNVLRLGAFELLFSGETPAPVALNEAIEIARRYGSADSPAFVNGVLDRLRQDAENSQAPVSETEQIVSENTADAQTDGGAGAPAATVEAEESVADKDKESEPEA